MRNWLRLSEKKIEGRGQEINSGTEKELEIRTGGALRTCQPGAKGKGEGKGFIVDRFIAPAEKKVDPATRGVTRHYPDGLKP